MALRLLHGSHSLINLIPKHYHMLYILWLFKGHVFGSGLVFVPKVKGMGLSACHIKPMHKSNIACIISLLTWMTLNGFSLNEGYFDSGTIYFCVPQRFWGYAVHIIWGSQRTCEYLLLLSEFYYYYLTWSNNSSIDWLYLVKFGIDILKYKESVNNSLFWLRNANATS
jgi:hypothetical protein